MIFFLHAECTDFVPEGNLVTLPTVEEIANTVAENPSSHSFSAAQREILELDHLDFDDDNVEEIEESYHYDFDEDLFEDDGDVEKVH